MKKTALLISLLTIYMTIFSQSLVIEVQNSYISIGEWTSFTVTATGDFENIKYSEPKDITMIQIGKSSSLSIVNRKNTRTYILNYKVKALKEGAIDLPVFFTQNSAGERIESEKVTIYVTKLEDDIITEHDTESDFESPYVKLFIDIPERNLYVGETIPVKIIAYFSTRYQPDIERAPYIKTGSFILDSSEDFNNMPDIIIQEERWLQISWNSYLTPLKSGNLEIEAVIDTIIKKPVNNSSFISSTEIEDIKTSTELYNISINPLPVSDRPASFTGAIGDFSINSSLDITDAKVGDPLTLSIDVFGKGNFQRISIPKLSSDIKNWKLYPESSIYKGSNGSNYKGVKQFQQVISPKSFNIKTLPNFKFSFFNPEKEEYIELSTDNIKLNISQGEFHDKELSNVINTVFSEQKENMRHKKNGKNGNLYSILKSRFFYITISLSIIMIISALIILLLYKSRENKIENINKKQNLILVNINKEEKAKHFHEALLLYRELIRESQSYLKDINPAAMTSSDIENNNLKKVFTALDELYYSKREFKENEYQELTRNILKELKC